MLTPLDAFATTDGLTPVIAILVLMALGLVLIFSGSRERAKTVSKRVERVRDTPNGQKDAVPKHRLGARVTPDEGQDVSDAEHRQIVRGYSRIGVPPETAYAYFQATRLFFMAAFAGSAFFPARGLFDTFFAAGLLAMAVPAAIGWYLPLIYLRGSINRRRKAVSTGLPDALELLAVCIEAGLSLENGLQRVSTELKRSQPELGEELALTWAEINILPDRDQALQNFANRVDTPSVRSVVGTLVQTLHFGTPLARSLRVVAADVRADQLTALEEKANRLPALMTVPVMVFIMPTIFLIIGGPAALKLMEIFYK